MKKLVLAIGLAGVLAVPTAQATLQVAMTRVPGTFSGFGGEFQATANTDSGWSAYNIVPGSSFQTFCLETGENIMPPYTADVVVNNTSAVWGGVGPTGDPISKATAWLFSQFASGSLSGYDYTVGSGRATDAGNLQKAIWWLEQESSAYSGIGDTEADAASADNEWLDLAKAQLGYATYLAMRTDNANGAYGVRVMNLYDLNGDRAKDMLMVPEPTTILAGALLLLPFAASTIRRFRKTS